MKFDGKYWKQSRKVVALPKGFWAGEHRNYVGFGRICSKDTPGAIKTQYSYSSVTAVITDGDEARDNLNLDETMANTKSPEGDAPEKNANGEWYFPVYAVQVKGRTDVAGEDNPTRGYSLTHLLYGADGYAYLMLDGKFYVRRWRKAKQTA
jgi:hypothetical protein